MIRVALILTALNFISSQTINRYGTTTANFLEIGVGSGPTAMGDAQVALADDVSSIYWNPAGLGFLDGKELAMRHVNWLPGLADDLYYEFLAYRKKMVCFVAYQWPLFASVLALIITTSFLNTLKMIEVKSPSKVAQIKMRYVTN